ncbi:hypothetical protein FRC07_009386 [Ceratobasidium sp. 392]|nr:hypothetical protein FRC07_009386 [Ceratobasidium sp. 392]
MNPDNETTISDAADEFSDDLGPGIDVDDEQMPAGGDSKAWSAYLDCSKVLRYMKSLGMNLDDFLDAVCYGNKYCRNRQLFMDARRYLRTSPHLMGILDRLHTPPRLSSKGKRSPDVAEPLERWASLAMGRIFRRELLAFSDTMQCDVEEIVNEETLKDLTFESILDEVETRCPRLFSALATICEGTRRDRQRKSDRDVTFCIVMFISALSYQVSQKNNRVQMFVCIYMKAKGSPKALYALFHHSGLSLSYNWVQEAVKTISVDAMTRAVDAYMNSACVIVFDNLMLSFKVKYQRADKQTATNNGTAITLIPLPSEATTVLNNGALFREHRRRIQELYMAGTMSFLSPDDLFRPADEELINKRLQYNILASLFRVPGLADSKLLEDCRLQPPAPIDLLPSGEAHRSKQFMLGTVDLDETTYSGCEAVMTEALSQLNHSTPESLRELVQSRQQSWVGDQLSFDRMDALAAMKQLELNTFDRHNWTLRGPGWLHILMNLGRAVYHVSYGTSTGLLFARDVANLHRSGLKAPTKQKGPEYHTLRDALLHILEARYWGLWMWHCGVSKLEDLVEWANQASVDQILAGVERIWQERASDRAITLLRDQTQVTTTKVGRKTVTTTSNEDPVLETVISSMIHLMLFEEVHRSVRFGDVGMLDLMLPYLLQFFSGAGNPRYAKMIAHMLQWKFHEAPPGVNEIVRRYTWLVNFTGRPDGFYAIDHRQELNNLLIRMHGPPPQSATWEMYRMISPTMPVLSAVIEQFDRRFSDFHRSRRHHIPDPTDDIKLLVQKQVDAKIHGFDPARTCSAGNKTIDPLDEGNNNLFDTNYLQNLQATREKYYGQTNLEEAYPDQDIDRQALARRMAGLSLDVNMEEVGEGGEMEPQEGNEGHVTPPTANLPTSSDHRSPSLPNSQSSMAEGNDEYEPQGSIYDEEEGLEIDEIANRFYSLSLDIL